MLLRFLRDRRGNIAVLSAIIFTSVVGVTGLVVEYGNGLLSHMQDQRIADVAATGGATVYNATSSTAAMNAAVANIATLNGLASGAAVASLVSSPSGDGNQAVKVTVSTSAPLVLSRVLQPNSSLSINVSSYAEVKPGAQSCIIALNAAGTGVTLSGGTAVSAPNCAVASDNTISVPCGDTITTTYAYYNSSSTPYEPCNGIQAPSGGHVTVTKTYTSDPLVGTAEVLGATGRLSTVAAITSPTGPSNSSGGMLAFSGSNIVTTEATLAAQGCVGTYASSVWTVTCLLGTVSFGTVSASGSVTVNFNLGGASSTVYNFMQVSNGAATMNFGPGIYNIAQGILSTNGGSVLTFGAGTFNIGYSTSSCNGSTHYSICNTGPTMTFGGPSTFVLAGGIYVKGGTALAMGSGTTNSFNIGAASDGNSLSLGGGSQTILADATGSGDIFQMAGNMNDPSGGTCLKLGAAAEHDINGYFLTAGGNVLGAGVYTITDYVSLGGSNGGDVTCWGATTGMSGTGITLVIGGSSLFSDSHCAGPGCAFYVAAGYGNVNLTAPTSGNTQNLVVIGPTSSSNAADAVFTEGASNTSLSGAVYFPYGPVSLSGAASVGNGTGQCLELIGSQVSLAGGSALASSCNIPGAGVTDNGVVALVQ